VKNPEKDPSRGLVRTGIRLPSKQIKWLNDQAKEHHRSRNAQIVSLIEAAQMAIEQDRDAAG
jgi:hypothetical protein